MKKDNLKEKARKKEVYQKPEIKSEAFDLGVYGFYGIFDQTPNGAPLGCSVPFQEL